MQVHLGHPIGEVLEGSSDVHGDLEKLEERSEKNLIKICLLGQDSPLHWYRLGTGWQGSSSAGKDLLGS